MFTAVIVILTVIGLLAVHFSLGCLGCALGSLYAWVRRCPLSPHDRWYLTPVMGAGAVLHSIVLWGSYLSNPK